MRAGITKSEALEAVEGMGAFEASEALAGMLSSATDRNVAGIQAALMVIDYQLEEWGAQIRRAAKAEARQ